MAIEYSILDEKRAILVRIDGAVQSDQLQEMRRSAVDLTARTGFTDFIFDMREMESLENGDPAAIVDLGNAFKGHNISVWTNTAFLMPVDKRAYEQVELLLQIEINSGRGVLDYVESLEEAFVWFEEMANRVRIPKAAGKSVPSS